MRKRISLQKDIKKNRSQRNSALTTSFLLPSPLLTLHLLRTKMIKGDVDRFDHHRIEKIMKGGALGLDGRIQKLTFKEIQRNLSGNQHVLKYLSMGDIKQIFTKIIQSNAILLEQMGTGLTDFKRDNFRILLLHCQLKRKLRTSRQKWAEGKEEEASTKEVEKKVLTEYYENRHRKDDATIGQINMLASNISSMMKHIRNKNLLIDFKREIQRKSSNVRQVSQPFPDRVLDISHVFDMRINTCQETTQTYGLQTWRKDKYEKKLDRARWLMTEYQERCLDFKNKRKTHSKTSKYSEKKKKNKNAEKIKGSHLRNSQSKQKSLKNAKSKSLILLKRQTALSLIKVK